MKSVIDTLFATSQNAFLFICIFFIAILIVIVFVVFINNLGDTYVKEIKILFITLKFAEKQKDRKNSGKKKKNKKCK